MKFSHSLKFNSVPEWRQHYINYGALKKLSYAIEKREEEGRQLELLEQHSQEIRRRSLSLDMRGQSADMGSTSGGVQQPLLDRASSMRLSIAERGLDEGRAVSQADFQASLNSELQRIMEFFIMKEAELRAQLEKLQAEARAAESTAPHTDGEQVPRPSFWKLRASKSQKEDMRLKLSDLYVQLVDLLEFINLNHTGFRKILKKHDKVTSQHVMKDFMPLVASKLSTKRQQDVGTMIDEVLELYAMVLHDCDRNAAEVALKRNLREHVVWERETIWRDMLALERRTVTAKVEGAAESGLGHWWDKKRKAVLIGLALLVFFVLLNLRIWRHEPPKRRCTAMLAMLVLLWTTEALPLYVTSMLVPFLTVTLRILPDHSNGGQLPASDAAAAVFKVMFSQVIMLLLGGFAIAGALSKHYIAKRLATNILSRVGTKPRNVVLANMFVATFASMWISNVAAPVLCFSLVQPILRTLPSHHPLSKCLIMGIALASNVGGMTSPISSPQNIFAIERMSEDGEPPSWLDWFMVALPVSVVCNLLIWLLLLAVYQPGTAIREVRPMRPVSDAITFQQVFVVVVSSGTVALWCANTILLEYVGSQGIVAIIPLVLFFGFGILGKDDFNNFLWHVVMLAQGGLVLGQAVQGSGLLSDLAQVIRDATTQMSLWGVLVTFCGLVLVCTTFISHTVGAMVILPIVQTVGEKMMPTPHPRLLVMASALMCSGAMGLPISGFPNMNAVSLEDATGKTYVNTLDFLKVGLAGSVMALGVVVSLGYVIMVAIGF